MISPKFLKIPEKDVYLAWLVMASRSKSLVASLASSSTSSSTSQPLSSSKPLSLKKKNKNYIKILNKISKIQIAHKRTFCPKLQKKSLDALKIGKELVKTTESQKARSQFQKYTKLQKNLKSKGLKAIIQ